MHSQNKYELTESEKCNQIIEEFEEYKSKHEEKHRLLKHQNMLTEIKMKELLGLLLLNHKYKSILYYHRTSTRSHGWAQTK